MQKQREPRRVKRQVSEAPRGRVVNLRTWKARKRFQAIRGRVTWIRVILRAVCYVLAGAAAVAALLSCIPSTWQARWILDTWSLGTVGMACALALRAMYDIRRANRVLMVNLVCLGVSLVVGITGLR
ncbi:MAG: hypothetical protein K6T78_07680 [Alicyclobacillus sp.]|nr:hypothetical protein [Alicyclobacillus sp.]